MKSLSEQQAEIQAELKQLENRQKILLNRKHKEERNPSLEYKGALIHHLGAVRSAEGILQTAFAMWRCTPQTPCALADKQHSLRRILPVNKSDYATRKEVCPWLFTIAALR